MPSFEMTSWIGAQMTSGISTSGLLAQAAGSGGWIDQAVLIVMVGLAVFAVCRSTRRQ